MVHIYFETKEQAERIMHIFSQQFKNNDLLSYINYYQNDSISLVVEEDNYVKLLEITREAILSFIRDDLFLQWLLKIVREKFYFSDKEECDQIVEMAVSVMQEDKRKNEAFWNELRQKIDHSLAVIFERKVSLSFPSFLKFRMKGVMNYLLDYVEIAIDEYKMEQEFQHFLHKLRAFMLSKSPSMEELHLVHQKDFKFYNEFFSELEKEEVKQFIDRKLFYDYPMYIDSHVLAPLISIAPRNLYIYCDQDDYPLIITIQRIFEERVQILPIARFESNKIDAQMKST
ncbi:MULTISPECIES: sporulation protein YtxC [Bacillus]|uniref:sporulation protein YtxC n=1 Tax=Bacillus TaxID=1386 RepID=UPI00031A7A8B|nr:MULTISPECIES: sporulation protein YtxC [Bacillus]